MINDQTIRNLEFAAKVLLCTGFVVIGYELTEIDLTKIGWIRYLVGMGAFFLWGFVARSG